MGNPPGGDIFCAIVLYMGILVSRRGRKNEASDPTLRVGGLRKAVHFILPFVAVAILGVVVFFVFSSNQSTASVTTISNKLSDTSPPNQITQKVKTLNDLLTMSPKQLADVDIAKMNLLCATGLPGAEKLDIDKCLSRLDEYARRVRHWTDQNMFAFRQNPGKYKNSEAKFRVLLLFSVLQKEYGVHYNERGERNCDFNNSKNPFIHGMIDDPNGGTCASIPVMYVAVGRRLGYPMKLVLAKTHIFARWENSITGEKFNIEGTNIRFNDYLDSHYCKWPYPISDAELKEGWYLKSLTPAEELAVFLQNRACCLMDNGRFKEAELAYTHSYQLAPQNPFGRQQIASAKTARDPSTVRRGRIVPISLFEDEFHVPQPRRPQTIDVEQINAINRANMQRMSRPPQPPSPASPSSSFPNRVNYPKRP